MMIDDIFYLVTGHSEDAIRNIIVRGNKDNNHNFMDHLIHKWILRINNICILGITNLIYSFVRLLWSRKNRREN